ncbi:unnamed protein product [Microthlaspi erraticum]|uniref:Reverse transcriptase domain-containing protein n=1 Tax=Microthlaspi erraticum TaxID=1685480 RepID=A0A6D2IW09_9BRAS|nr:unnamed protein product [Microthlaspi erraticum]
MNRPKRKKELSFMEELKERNLIEEGELVDIPDLENEDLIEENTMSVIVRCLNPTVHKVGGLIKALPVIWGLEDRVKGRGIEGNRAQFIFQCDRDLNHVLTRGPWFVNGWIVALDQWSPNPGPDFLNLIPFWIRISGLPIHQLKKQAVESLISPLGRIDAIELHAKNSDSLEYVRAHAWVKADAPFQLRRQARFKTGEIVTTELVYEKLLKAYFVCKRLTHDQNNCPFQVQVEAHVPQASKATVRKEISKGPTRKDPKGKGTMIEKDEQGKGSNQQLRLQTKSLSEPMASRSNVKDRLQWTRKEEQYGHGTAGSSGSKHSPSVFLRLGSPKIPSGAKGSGEKRSTEKEYSSSGSKKETIENGEADGANLSLSVFERLGEGGKDQIDLGSLQHKRRRLSSSDERSTKKAKTGGNKGETTPISVFQRLGDPSSGSGSKGSEKKKHSVHVTAEGVGNTPTVRHLREVHGRYFPEVTFLCETKNRRKYMEGIVEQLGYFDLHTVEPIGKSGGLALMWKDSVSVKIIHSDNRIIDTIVKWEDKEFFLTCVYGDPVRRSRGIVWERIERLKINRQGAWMMTGDFNELTEPKEKEGGVTRRKESCQEFKQMLLTCGLWEIKHNGHQLSWYGQRQEELVQCRLDRTVANQLWMELFGQASATYLPRISSDHSPLITSLIGDSRKNRGSFKYDHRCFQREGFAATVEKSWVNSGTDRGVSMMKKITDCRKAISQWKRANSSNSARKIQELHHKIDLATRTQPFQAQEMAMLKRELKEEYNNEETFWRMKSRVMWLNNGDRNTKYFHAVTKNRRAQNRIKCLKDEQGKEWLGEENLGRVAEAYFKKLFGSESIDMDLEADDLYHADCSAVTSEQNEKLMAPVTHEEVKQAVFDINPNKCPGPDGINGHFYQQFWGIVGHDIFKIVQSFITEARLEPDMNKTNICLIPKKLKPESMLDYRPISLSNVVYKIIAKILAKSFKKVLPHIISNSQAAFIQGRLITDNILVAHELLHALNSKNQCAMEFIAVKTDISKSFDRVEWTFLEKAMQTLGFSARWIRLIMSCVTTVNYQVLINGIPHGSINPTRGIRQGDPLSPYLFIICTEMLARMLQKAERDQRISGIRVARNAPAVTHLMFADDSMFYCKSSDEELEHLSILDKYSLASGQRINYQKSSIYFGKLIPSERREVIKKKLGIDQEGGTGRYLGLPESFGGAKVSILSYLKDNLSQRVSGWQNHLLSAGGKEVLLKAVALALPT